MTDTNDVICVSENLLEHRGLIENEQGSKMDRLLNRYVVLPVAIPALIDNDVKREFLRRNDILCKSSA